jgi:hypothetical protein
MTPSWLLDIFAAIMLMVAAVSAARLVVPALATGRAGRAGPSSADIDVAHLLMGIAMAGMLASALTTMPDTAWEVIFGLLTVWFACRVVGDLRAEGSRALAGGHWVPHMAHSAAMLYMFLALAAPAPGGGMSGMSMGGSGMQSVHYPTLALVFGLILVGYSVWDVDQLSGHRYGGRASHPALAVGSRIAMGVTMAFMLMIMI